MALKSCLERGVFDDGVGAGRHAGNRTTGA
jgi:hypothetical protein